MNITSLVGLFVIAGVLFFGVFKNAHSPALFLDAHAMILVLGGTLGTTLIAFPFKKLLGLFDFVMFGVIFKRRHSELKVIKDIIQLQAAWSVDENPIQRLYKPHPFLVEACHLMKMPHLNLEQVSLILNARKEAFKKQYENEAKMLVAIAKFPPALGLLGASTGMIEMMSNLGEGGTSKIGAAMAIALVATFWGIALANLIILPFSDYANRVTQDDVAIREIIIEGILLTGEGIDRKTLRDHLTSKLPIGLRIQAVKSRHAA